MTIDDKVHITYVTEYICLSYLYLHDFVSLLESMATMLPPSPRSLHFQQPSYQMILLVSIPLRQETGHCMSVRRPRFQICSTFSHLLADSTSIVQLVQSHARATLPSRYGFEHLPSRLRTSFLRICQARPLSLFELPSVNRPCFGPGTYHFPAS